MLAILLAIVIIFTSPVYALERFVNFPSIGQCTGTYVRYRSDPDTESEILGRLNAPERVVVLGQTAVDGEVWYEIGNPHSQDSAFVFGKYIKPLFDETDQQSAFYKLFYDILITYGPTKEHDDYDGPEVRRKYDEAGNLIRVDARNKDCAFGNIKIGDDVSKLEEILGSPDGDEEDQWIYELDNVSITFKFDDGKINRMIYEE